MKTIRTVIVLVILLFSASSMADVFVNGYYKDNGTYVKPYYRSDPNGNPNDNWSTQGNTNPYTGEEGHKKQNPYYPSY